MILAAWVLPAVVIVTFAVLQLRSGARSAGAFGVASYAAQAETLSSPAADFQLPDLEGAGDRSLAQLRGHVAVLNFWASWCAPCRDEAPDLERTYKAYRAQGVEFLGIDQRDDMGSALEFVREFGITYPSAFDPGGTLAYRYQLFGLPTTVIVDANGQSAYRFTGIVTSEALRSALDEILAREG